MKNADIRRGRSVDVPRSIRHISRILRLGSTDNADNSGIEQDISRSYVSHEWPNNGYQRYIIVPVGTTDRCIVRRLGKKIFPSDNRSLYMRTNTTDDDQHLVVFRYVIDKRRFRLYFFRCLCLRSRHYGRTSEIKSLRKSEYLLIYVTSFVML